jgi:hypothetical protein
VQNINIDSERVGQLTWTPPKDVVSLLGENLSPSQLDTLNTKLGALYLTLTHLILGMILGNKIDRGIEILARHLAAATEEMRSK